MSTIVEARVPATEFALGETFEQVPDAEFRVVRLVAHGQGYVLPFLWGAGDDRERLREALEADPTTADVDFLAEFEDDCLIRVDWQARVKVFVSIIGEVDATILDASAERGAWHLQIFFPEHEAVSKTYECCDEYGIDIDLERICRLSDTCQNGQLGLTEEQYETLLNAYEAGYYDVPRKVNQEELAEYFDVSHQALSERLRRAHETVISNALYHKLQRHDRSVAPRLQHEIDT